MSTSKNIFLNSVNLLPLSLLKKNSKVHTLLPYHHTVSNQFIPHIKHLYPYKNEQQFIADLLFLKKNFDPIHPDELLAFIEKNESLPQNKFLLSFDDGFSEVHRVIAPILKQHQLPALIFINPAFIDNKEMFYRNKLSLLIHEILNNQNQKKILVPIARLLQLPNADVKTIVTHLKNIRTESNVIQELAEILNFSFSEYLQKVQPYLSLSQLQQLQQQGLTIGAHSWSHPYYNRIPLTEQIQETNRSCHFVQENKLCTKSYFSFPHTDVGLSQNLFNELKKNTDLLFGIQNQKIELNNKMLHRFNAERPQINLQKQVKGMLLYSWANHQLGKNKINRP